MPKTRKIAAAKPKGRQAVNSTAIRSIGHDPESKRLEIEFRRGPVYAYDDVSSRVASNLRNASSIGRHFNRNVRNNYDYELIRAGQRRRKRGR